MFTDFKGNLLRELVSRNSWEFLRNFTPRKFWEFLLITSPEIPEKFLGLGHQVYGFLGELKKRISFEEFPRNSWEFLWNFFKEIPKNFSGIFLRKFLRNSRDFSQNFQVPFFSNRCLWGSLLLCSALTKSYLLCILIDKKW